MSRGRRTSPEEDAPAARRRPRDGRGACGGAATPADHGVAVVERNLRHLHLTIQIRDAGTDDRVAHRGAVDEERRVGGELFAEGPGPGASDQAAGIVHKDERVELALEAG